MLFCYALKYAVKCVDYQNKHMLNFCMTCFPTPQKILTQSAFLSCLYISERANYRSVSNLCKQFHSSSIWFLFILMQLPLRVFVGRCWSSRREVVVNWICSAKLLVQILAHNQSLLKANFLYLWLTELKLLLLYCEAHSSYDSIGVAPGKPCTPCNWRDYDKFWGQ